MLEYPVDHTLEADSLPLRVFELLLRVLKLFLVGSWGNLLWEDKDGGGGSIDEGDESTVFITGGRPSGGDREGLQGGESLFRETDKAGHGGDKDDDGRQFGRRVGGRGVDAT